MSNHERIAQGSEEMSDHEQLAQVAQRKSANERFAQKNFAKKILNLAFSMFYIRFKKNLKNE